MADLEDTRLVDGDLRLRPPRVDEAELYARWWADKETLFGFAAEPRAAAEIRAAFPEMEAEARDIGHWIEFVIEAQSLPAKHAKGARRETAEDWSPVVEGHSGKDTESAKSCREGWRAVGSIWLSHWDLDARTCELNILIGEPEMRGQGLARRAIRLLCGWAFRRMDLRRIYLCPRDDHIPAQRSYAGAGARMGEVREEVVTWRGETVCFREMYFERSDFEPGATPSL